MWLPWPITFQTKNPSRTTTAHDRETINDNLDTQLHLKKKKKNGILSLIYIYPVGAYSI